MNLSKINLLSDPQWLSPLFQRLGWTLIHSLWEGFVVAAVLAVLLAILKNAPASRRYLAGCAAMAALLLSAAATFCLVTVAPAANEIAAPHVSRESNVANNSDVKTVIPRALEDRNGAGIPQNRIADNPALAESNHVLMVASFDRIKSILPALTLAWLIGVLGFSIYRLSGGFYARRLVSHGELPASRWTRMLDELCRQMCVSRPVRLLQTTLMDVPIVMGWLRPVILLPVSAISGLTPEQVRGILAHELVHVLRQDYLVNLVQTAVETLLFYHPATWWISRQIRRERENCCDDIAAGAIGSPLVYAKALAEIEEMRHMNLPALAASGSALLPRVRRILGLPQAPSHPMAGIAVAVLLALAILLPLAPGRGAARAAVTTQPTVTTVDVQCMDGDNKPVAGAEVYFARQITPKSVASQTTFGPVISDSSGIAHFANIPAATDPMAQLHQIAFARVPGKLSGCVANVINKPTDTWSPLVVSLSPSRKITGKVTVPVGSKPEDVTVSTFAAIFGNHPLIHAIIDRNIDPFTFGWLPAFFDCHPAADGSFAFSDMAAEENVYLGATGPGLAEEQRMHMGGPADAVNFAMKPEGVIEGQITMPDGKPAANLKVSMRPVNMMMPSNHGYTAISGGDGRYRVGGLPAMVMRMQLDSISDWVLAPVAVTPESGKTAQADLQLQTGALASGTITSVDGKPLAGVQVSSIFPAKSNENLQWSTTDAAGKYALRLPVGDSQIYIGGVPDGYSYPNMPDSGQDIRTVTVTAGMTTLEGPSWALQPSAPEDRAPLTMATVDGRVVDHSGNPVANIAISDSRVENWGATKMPVSDPQAATTDAQGKFHMTVTAGIEHTLSPSSDDYDHPKSGKFTPETDEKVELENLVVKPQPILGYITGVVTDPSGKPLDGVMTSIFDRQSPKTDSDGKFSIAQRNMTGRAMVYLGRDGFITRNWSNIPPGAKDVHLVLYPDPDPLKPAEIPNKPASPQTLVGRLAPAFHVDWILTAGDQPPTSSNNDVKQTVVAFTSDAAARTTREIESLKKICDGKNANLIVIFMTNSEETGVRETCKDLKGVSIGIDQYLPKGFYGATQTDYLAYQMTSVFILAADGTITHNQHGVTGLESAF